MKRCPKCDTEKSLADFYKDRSRKDGLSGICRDCRTAARNAPEGKAYLAAWKAANLDRVRENNRRAYERRDRVAETERLRQHYLANREDRIRQAREWDLAHPERRKATRTRWKHRNPEKIRESRRKTNDTRRGMRPSKAAAAFAPILLRDPCAYCGHPAEEVDHIDSVVRGGNGEWDNLTATCGPCNRRKNAMPLLRFLLRRIENFTPA